MINSMQQSSSREVNSRSVSQEMSCLLWYPKIQHPFHKPPSLVLIRNQVNAVHNFLPYFFKNHFNTVLPPSSILFFSGFPTKILCPVIKQKDKTAG